MLRAHHWPIPGGDKGLAEDYPRRHKPRCLRQSGPLQSELRDGGRLHHNRASQQSNSGEVVGEPTNWVVQADFPQIYPLSGQAIEPFPGLEIRLAPILPLGFIRPSAENSFRFNCLNCSQFSVDVRFVALAT